MGKSEYWSTRSRERRRDALVAGTRTAPPERKKSTHAWRPPLRLPSRCVASVSTASVLTTGRSHSPKKLANASWRFWLRSSRETRAPVSSSSSPATTERLDDVGAVFLGQVGYARFQGADQAPYAVCGPCPGGGGRSKEFAQRETHDLRALSLQAPRSGLQRPAQILGKPDRQLVLHRTTTVPLESHCNALQCAPNPPSSPGPPPAARKARPTAGAPATRPCGRPGPPGPDGPGRPGRRTRGVAPPVPGSRERALRSPRA